MVLLASSRGGTAFVLILVAAIALPVLIRRVRYAGRTRPPIAPWPAAKPQLRCVECGAEGDGAAEGWKTYLTDDDPPEAVTYCPDCAAREFHQQN